MQLLQFLRSLWPKGNKMPVKQMTPLELKARLDAGDKLPIIDVREQREWDFVNLEHVGAVLLPMGEIPDRMDELDKDTEMVIQCRSGGRSAQVIQYLQQHGYTKLHNLDGGILRWSDDIDPSMPKY